MLAFQHGARVDECVHYNELLGNLLHLACKYAGYEKVLSLLEHTQVVRYFLDIGSDMEYRNTYGRTPLLEVSAMRYSRDSDISYALLVEGANPSVADLEGRNALHLIIDVLEHRSARADTIDASLLGFRPEGDLHHRIVKLLRAGCDPHDMDHLGQTPSSYIQHSPVAWVVWARALYEAGWNPEAIDKLVPDPIVPTADILDGTCLKYRRIHNIQWCRPRQTGSSTRIIELDDEFDTSLTEEGNQHRITEVHEVE